MTAMFTTQIGASTIAMAIRTVAPAAAKDGEGADRLVAIQIERIAEMAHVVATNGCWLADYSWPSPGVDFDIALKPADALRLTDLLEGCGGALDKIKIDYCGDDVKLSFEDLIFGFSLHVIPLLDFPKWREGDSILSATATAVGKIRVGTEHLADIALMFASVGLGRATTLQCQFHGEMGSIRITSPEAPALEVFLMPCRPVPL